MTESILQDRTGRNTADRVQAGLKRRYAAERRFRIYGLISILTAMGFLAALLTSIAGNGYGAFLQTHVRLDILFSKADLDPGGTGDPAVLRQGDYDALIKDALAHRFPDVTSRADKRKLNGMISASAGFDLAQMVADEPEIVGTTQRIWLPATGDIDVFVKGNVSEKVPETERRIKDVEIGWVKALQSTGDLELKFNTRFFTSGDSRNPEVAGIWGAVVGSLFTLIITLALAFPLGVMAAVYLEEFAPKNRWTDLVEVNINNLAAVPSIVFGLLGLAVFLNFFHLPRSAPLVGGMVLALITLPTIIIASRAALKAVPPSIREAALGVGASRMQTVTHHVLPLAMPGMLTGTIIGMAHALGETAPLLMIGMVAFIVDIPTSPLDPATVLPVQVYLWADSAERAFVERTSAAILVLIAFLICMNLLAIILRKRFERRW
ncbi:MAG: phosphate ABC transporter permease PstA [Alphaproteobacteria bacterium]|nr:phosphate ABC transporter permease PstA [Alphaproteobacteria bacterium]